MTFVIYLTQLIRIQTSLALQTCYTRQVIKVIANIPITSFHLTLTELKNILLDLILALQGLYASHLLPSNSGNKSLLVNLLRLNLAVSSNNFNIKRFLPLLNAILRIKPNKVIWEKVYATVIEPTPLARPLLLYVQTLYLRNISSFTNSSKRREYVDYILKEELGLFYIGIPGLYKAFFREVEGLKEASAAVFKKCKEGDNLLYAKGGWCNWPKSIK